MISIGSRDQDAVGAKSALSRNSKGCAQWLACWLSTSNSPDTDRALTRLMEEVARPVIDGIMRRKFGGDSHLPDAEDIASDARCQFVRYLHGLRENVAAGKEPPFVDLPAYVATVAYTAWANHLRRRYPARAMLLNRLRHLLGNRAGPQGFALWGSPTGEWLAGFAVWRETRRVADPTPRCQWLLTDPMNAAKDAFPGADYPTNDLARLTAGLLDWLGGPLELRDLASVLMKLLGLIEPHDAATDNSEEAENVASDSQPSPHDSLRWKEYLGWLWREVMTLPLRQRTAFLCHSSLLREMEVVGLTSIRAVASALEIPPARMAELWARLPLNDLAIAALLGNGSRQQIINLRKVARASLGEAWQAFLKT